VQAVERVAELLVELDDYALGHFGYGGYIANAGAYHGSAVILDVTHLDYGDVDVAYLAVAQLLGGL